MLDIDIYGLGLAASLALGLVAWGASVAIKDASIADAFWPLYFIAMATIYVTLAPEVVARSYLVFFLVTLWGARLSAFITRRQWGRAEGRRYAAVRAANDPGFWWKSLYLIFGLQAVIAWMVSLALLPATLSSAPLGWLDYAGVALWLLGLFFESVGDQQLADFSARPENRGRVMDRGLWRYTRHPNYFGEACMWWGLYLIALSAGGWWAIVSPVTMTWLLMRISGVALLEQDIAERRPEYRDYVRRTNVLVPGPPRIRSIEQAAGGQP